MSDCTTPAGACKAQPCPKSPARIVRNAVDMPWNREEPAKRGKAKGKKPRGRHAHRERHHCKTH